jgi:hypothetical protein
MLARRRVQVSATQVPTESETSDILGVGADNDQHARRRPERPLWRSPERWTPRGFATALAPAAIYLCLSELAHLVLDWMAARNGVSPTSAVTSWDGQWFLDLAAGGYDHVPPEMGDAFGRRSAETPLAFFPGYPLLIRVAAQLPGAGLVAGALLVSTVSGLVCAYGLARLGTRVGGSRRTGLVLVALFAATPMSIVLSMAYSEALFCALAVWALVCTLERRWLLAGLFCAAAGTVRPTAAALIAAIWLAAAISVVRRRDGWRPWVSALLAPVGMAAYLGWVGLRTGHWDGWRTLQQRGWDSGFDGGAATLRFSLQLLAVPRTVFELATVWLVAGAVVLFVVAIRNRTPLPLVVYAAGVLVMNLGSTGLMNSKARLLLPAFTLLLPLAVGLAKRRPGTVLTVLAGMAVTSTWFGAYSLTAWPYAI